MVSRASADPTRFDTVRARIRDLMNNECVASVAVAVAHGERIVWEEGFGWADVPRRIRADAHTLYSLASISKPITTTALMRLVEQGLVDLDGPINNYLGASKLTAYSWSTREATVRRVANHTSGLARHYQFFYEDESEGIPSREESIRRYGVLVQKPGESYVYSNFGYSLLECLIERISGKTYAEFVRDEVFGPLGLTESTLQPTAEFPGRTALRYCCNRPVPFYDFDHRGGSAVYMSAHDLVRFGLYHLYGRVDGQCAAVLERGTRLLMREQAIVTGDPNPQKSYYGVGWAIGESQGLQRFGHTGGMPGVATRLSIFPQPGIVIAVLANGEDMAVHGLEDEILHILLPETIRRAHGFRPGAELVGCWQGTIQTYVGQVRVRLEFVEDGQVLACVGEGPAQEVIAVSRDPRTSVLTLGGVVGEIGTPDAARYAYDLQFSLRQRAPGVLNGAVTAVSRSLPDRWGSALSYWTEVRRVEVAAQ